MKRERDVLVVVSWKHAYMFSLLFRRALFSSFVLMVVAFCGRVALLLPPSQFRLQS